MKMYQLFYLPNGWYTAVVGGFSGLLAATVVDWAPVSASLGWRSALIGVLAMVVFVTTVTVINLVARLRAGGWLVDA